MRKLKDDEIATVITREMLAMMQDKNLSYEQRAKIFCAIVFGETIEDTMTNAFAKSLEVGFKRINDLKKRQIYGHRKSAKEYQERMRNKVKQFTETDEIDTEENQCESIDINHYQFRGNTKHSKAYKNIPPISPKGDSGDSSSDTSADSPATVSESAAAIVGEIESRYWHKCNERSLRRAVSKALEKNTAAEILDGFDRWMRSDEWNDADHRYAPRKIAQWIRDRGYLNTPVPKKDAPPERDEEIGVKEIL